MTTLQKKKKLIEEAEKLTDSDFIDYLLGLIELESSPVASKPHPLTELEKKAINQAETDIKTGNVITDKQAEEETASWL